MGQSKMLTAKETAFAQAFVETGNQSEAYRRVYKSDTMKPTTINRKAKEVADREHVAAYIAELQGEHRQRHNITVDDLVDELEEARKVGKNEGSAAAMVSATMGKAKLLGMDKQIIDHTSSDGSMTPVPDYSGLTDDELRQLHAIAIKSRGNRS